MTVVCDAAIHICAIRATRLDQLGNPLAGPNNVYISDKSIQLTATPAIEAGEDKTLIGGCDCLIATYRGYDKLKRFDLELDIGVIETGLLEMLTGGTAIVDAQGQPIGVQWPNQLDCSQPAQPNIALEAWQTLWNDDRPETSYQYLQWVWPSTHWQIGAMTLQNDFLQPRITGFTRGNSNWKTGIFHDYPATVTTTNPLGSMFMTNSIPTARCGWQTFPIT